MCVPTSIHGRGPKTGWPTPRMLAHLRPWRSPTSPRRHASSWSLGSWYPSISRVCCVFRIPCSGFGSGGVAGDVEHLEKRYLSHFDLRPYPLQNLPIDWLFLPIRWPVFSRKVKILSHCGMLHLLLCKPIELTVRQFFVLSVQWSLISYFFFFSCENDRLSHPLHWRM